MSIDRGETHEIGEVVFDGEELRRREALFDCSDALEYISAQMAAAGRKSHEPVGTYRGDGEWSHDRRHYFFDTFALDPGLDTRARRLRVCEIAERAGTVVATKVYVYRLRGQEEEPETQLLLQEGEIFEADSVKGDYLKVDTDMVEELALNLLDYFEQRISVN